MPRSFLLINRLRLCLLALFLLAPVFLFGNQVGAQRSKSAQTTTLPATTTGSQSQKKNLTRLNAGDTAEGSSITIFSDLPLNDYSAYRSGDRFYVLIPSADASRIATGLRGRGFQDVRAQRKGNDVLLSFRLLAGATARVSQKFNRLEILITVPALVAANSATTSSNTSTSNQSDPAITSSNTGGTGSNRSSASSGGSRSTGASSRYSNYPSTSSNPGTGSYSQEPTTSSSSSSTPDGISTGQDTDSRQTGSSTFTADTKPSPMMSPVATPPGDQIAQVQEPSGASDTTAQAPATTTAPSSGSSFGSQLKQNWLFIVLAFAVAGLIAWVLFARSRADREVVESHIETIRRAKPQAVLPAPTPAARVSPPVEVPSIKADLSDAAVTTAVVGAGVVDELHDEAEVKDSVTTEIAPSKPVAVEQASEDVAGLLAGEHYDEATIGTQHSAARQMIGAELLGALAGRNLLRRERARDAFIKHGYFEDSTRTLRTADSPAERASAARSLGLVRDESATPHLIAALEDTSPDVRRAAVESLAEVRDPNAVAALESLRDSEKDRKIPKALIQHAIEASVVGRMKTAAPQPLVAPIEATPISEEPTQPAHVDDSAAEVVETESPFELGYETANEQSLFEQADSVELIEVESEPDALSSSVETPQSDVQSEKILAEAVQPDVEVSEAPIAEWVDVDMSQPSASIPSVEAVDEIDESPLSTESAEASVLEMEPEAVEQVVEASPEVAELPQLPETPTEPEVLESPSAEPTLQEEVGLDVAGASDRDIELLDEDQIGVPANILRRLASEDASERVRAIDDLGRIGGEDSFREISASFDDESPEVRNAAARALFNLNPDRAGSFTRALREASQDRRRNIGAALSTSGLATEAISHLMGESREKTYDAFSLLFLMAKAGEVQPLMHAVEEHPNNEVRLAVVKLLALSGQQEILPAFRRLAVRGSLPTEVRSAVMEAIYQISSQSSGASS